MKNLTNKQKVIAISILVVLFCIGFLLGIFTGIGRRNREEKELNKVETNTLQSGNQNGNVFYASIEKISEYNGITSILVKGLDINDINYRGEFSFSINDETELLWRGTKIDISNLKVGQNISITRSGNVLESYPAVLTKVTKIVVLDDEIEENINSKVTTIDIESFFDVDKSVQQKFTLNQEEIYEIFDIIGNLKFSKETCDGLPSFYIKYNSKEKDGFITYGLETFNNEYHITSAEKGEAVLTQEQRDRLDKIINKYFKFLTMQVQE